MATTDLERLVVQMSLDIRKFEQQLARANGTTTRELRKIEGQFTSANKRIANAVVGFGRGLAVGALTATIAGIEQTIKSAIQQSALLGDLADRLGATTDQLQELQFGAVQANLGFDELSTGLERFSKNLGEARAGSGDLFKVLKANGLEIKSTFSENLKQFADLVKNAANEQDALLLITQAFGRGSSEFLEFLKNGSAGLDKFANDATAAGAKLDEAFIRKAQQIDDRWAALMLTMGVGIKSFVLGAITEFEKLDQIIGVRLDASGFSAIRKASAPPDSGAAGRRGLAPAVGRPTIVPNAEAERAAAEAMREANREREQAIRLAERMTEQFENAFQNTEQRIDAMVLETQLIGQNTQAQETARTELELLNAAKEAGIPIDEAVRANIQATAEAYGRAAASYETAQEAMEHIAEANNALRDSFQGFFKDILTGRSGVDALSDALGRLGDRLIDLALNQVFNSLFQTGAGGSQGGLLASLLHTGGVAGAGGARRAVSPLVFAGAPRMHSGGLAGNEVPAILKRGEIVIPENFPKNRERSGINVQVINNNGSSIRTEPDATGRSLKVIVEDAMADVAGNRRSKFNQVMASRGAGPATLRR